MKTARTLFAANVAAEFPYTTTTLTMGAGWRKPSWDVSKSNLDIHEFSNGEVVARFHQSERLVGAGIGFLVGVKTEEGTYKVRWTPADYYGGLAGLTPAMALVQLGRTGLVQMDYELVPGHDGWKTRHVYAEVEVPERDAPTPRMETWERGEGGGETAYLFESTTGCHCPHLGQGTREKMLALAAEKAVANPYLTYFVREWAGTEENLRIGGVILSNPGYDCRGALLRD